MPPPPPPHTHKKKIAKLKIFFYCLLNIRLTEPLKSLLRYTGLENNSRYPRTYIYNQDLVEKHYLLSLL